MGGETIKAIVAMTQVIMFFSQPVGNTLKVGENDHLDAFLPNEIWNDINDEALLVFIVHCLYRIIEQKEVKRGEWRSNARDPDAQSQAVQLRVA